MTTLIRSTKSASEWTKNDLRAYNITVTPQDVATFFGNPILPQPSIPQVILNNEESPNGLTNQDDRNFFFYLEQAMAFPPDSDVGGFAAHLLHLFEYNGADHFIRRHKDIPLFICGEHTHDEATVSLVDGNLGQIHLLVQEDKWHLGGPDAEAQLIAQAIGTFQHNNTCLQRIGLQPIQMKTIPGVTMMGSTPIFYKITITQDLVEAVETGQYPAKPTTVCMLVPPVDNPRRLSKNGMKPLNNRAVIFGCFEAFRQFI